MVTEQVSEVSEQLITSPEPQPEERNRGGRPAGSKTRPPDPGFFDRLKDLDWEKHLLYLYRLQPLVDRTSGGDPKYILKYSEAIDEDRVMQDHGSGVYQIRLTKSKEGSAKTNEIERHTFEIFNIKYPPQIPVGVWLDDHRNERWKGFKEIMQTAPTPQQNGTTGTDLTKFAKEIFQEARQGQVNPAEQFKSQTEIYKMGLADAKQNTPTSDGGVVELLKTFIPMLKPQPPDNSVVQVLTLQLQAERDQRAADREQAKADREAADKRAEAAEKRHNDLMTLMLNRKETSGLESVQQFAQIFAAVKGIGEGGLVTPTDNSLSGVFMDGLRDAMPDILRSVAPGVGNMLSGIGQGTPRPAPSVSRETLSPGVPPVSRETPSAQPAAAPQKPQLDMQFAPAYEVIFFSKAIISNYMKNGRSGLEFGDNLADGPGVMEIEKLKTAGPDNIIKFIALQIPALWGEVQPVLPRFRQFLGELMAWEPPTDDDDDDQPLKPEVIPGTANGAPKSKKKQAGGKAS